MRMVKQSSLWIAVVACVLGTCVVVEESRAFPAIRSDFFDAYPDAVGTRLDTLPSNNNHCGVCHYDFGGGGTRNLYGQAVEALPSISPAQILTLGSLDSDGDGFTNDQEILDLLAYSNTPTFPGLTPTNINLVSDVSVAEIEDHLVPEAVVPEAIPAVSDWGMLVMALSTLSGGTIIWRRAIV